ncbi:fibronectin type III-like domain-contianing protein [Halocatena marina]|uniref:Fibronectin type III-like domain-contianing protein n=2 Tax=Halocatena marina TaxID=2934937 RepID=A0ABD5YIW4_9EURY
MGFERVSLEAGQSKRVTIEASLSTLLTVPGDITGEKRGLVLEEGKYEITVGNLTETITVGTSGYTDWTPDSETGE